MATVTATPYGKFAMGLGQAQFDITSDTFKVMLTTSSYTPNVDTHEFVTSVTNEVSGSGYSAGGQTLTTVTWNYETDTSVTPNIKRMAMYADSALWTSVTLTNARYAVVYKSTGTAGTSRLVGYIDFGEDKSPTSEDFQVNFTNGVLRLALA